MASRKTPATNGLEAMADPKPAADGRETLERLREQLVARREALARRVTTATNDLSTLDQSTPVEQEEEAQEQNIARLLTGLDERGRAELAAIDDALAKIELGDYGRCENCGDEIHFERLLALPSARLCIACAEEAEMRRRQQAVTVATVAETEL